MHANFNTDLAELNRQMTEQEAQVLDLQEKLDVARTQHTKMVYEHGQLVAEAKVQFSLRLRYCPCLTLRSLGPRGCPVGS